MGRGRAPAVQPGVGRRHHHLQRHPGGHQGLHHHGGGRHQRRLRHRRLDHRHAHLGQGTVTAQCSALTPYTISLNAGANASTANDVTTRRMKNTNAAVTANNYVGYQLYQDAAHTLVWGATSGTNTQAGIGTGLAVPYIVYGQILNLSTNNPATGNYLDTVTATITY
uniref:Spore coat protein U domain-containing protein n=1 Tax=Panagrolaimus superbus TaxID=310955 RepID=A0A914Z0D4_9BILA